MTSNLDNSTHAIDKSQSRVEHDKFQGDTINPKRSEWLVSLWQIHSESSEVNEGLMQVLDGNVTCTGSSDVAETKFKVYNGGEDGTLTVFECVGGSSNGMVLCIDSNHQLTAREKSKDYNNFRDVEEDALFYWVVPGAPNQYQFRWKKDDKCIAFTKDGQPIPLDDPNKSTQETLFRGISLDNLS